MGFIGFLVLLVAIWLLWSISRNTADALDKQTALQYEIVALEKRLDEMNDLLKASLGASSAAPGSSQAEDISGSSGQKVNLNTSSANALTHLPKIGRAMAQRIVDGRPYGSVEELSRVQGISSEMISEIKDLVEI
ncbi:ComEA family DNA-binding protein [Hahella ganghwensis]|uniref:ComEA family DNA-binding protein n=1 Tax=Hahella ganghwensis TaxID=286420 RepID=UPI00036043E4|nr:helix-hairpin-helix domain-containing protein [Hahella ganghwensis]